MQETQTRLNFCWFQCHEMLTKLIDEIIQETFKSQHFLSAFDNNPASMIYQSTEYNGEPPKKKS